MYAATWRAFTYLLLFWILTIPTNPNPVQLRIILLGAARTGKYRAIDGPGARSALVPALTRRTVRASGASDLSDSARQQKGVCVRNVIRNVPAFRRRQPAFIGKYESLLLVTAGLPRDQSYLGTHARYAPKGSAYLPRDTHVMDLVMDASRGTRTYRWCSRNLSETINWRPYRRYGTRSPGLHYRVFLYTQTRSPVSEN